MRSGLCWVVATVLLACGQTSKIGGSTPEEDGGADAGGSASTGNAGSNAKAGAAEGGSDAGAGAGSSAGDATGANGGTGVVGGSAPVGGQGDDDPSLRDCQAPVAETQGGPREDGPPPTLGNCTTIGDDVILQRYADPKAKVPQGLFYERPGALVTWGSACALTPSDVVTRAPVDEAAIRAFVTNEWFYEAVYCTDNLRHRYRELSCDYFDGKHFSGSTEDFAFLGSLLWWQGNSNLSGAALLGYSVQVGNATDWVELCTLETAHGDFGLCDEISLYSTTNSISFEGDVRLGERKLVRTIKGQCH